MCFVYFLSGRLRQVLMYDKATSSFLVSEMIAKVEMARRTKIGSAVVECLTRDGRAAGSSLTGVTALCP